MPRPKTLARISRDLAEALAACRFAAPVSHVYSPLVYARRPHEVYLERWGGQGARVLFLGMNPGPFGMAQTGVPFGEVTLVRDYLGVEASVDRPAHEHPKRPIQGFACTRSEVSGARFWGWVKARWPEPASFFAGCFVANYCPLVFMDSGGKNLTPDKLPVAERDPLHARCDAALREVATTLGITHVVGIGAFAAARAEAALGSAVTISTILHPSPASPAANRGWAQAAEAQLAAARVPLP